MPRTTLPPTPAASTEIRGKDSSTLPATVKTFNLGPPAIAPKQTEGNALTAPQSQTSMTTNFSLPPPPTRSRTIIQMKPKTTPSEPSAKTPVHRSPKVTSKKANTASSVNTGTGKRQPSATSAAGKKIARKTAHSVIERRRRSKMNSEFATLKGMIPACTNQEMHKLAILQASIDYLRYLENCIVDLKTANNTLSTPLMQPQAPPPRLDTPRFSDDESGDEEEEEDDDEDAVMGGVTANEITHSTSPTIHNGDKSHKSTQSGIPSPALDAQYPSLSYASSSSNLPSPAFEPQEHHRHGSQSQFSLSESTSPTIMPNPEQDREATAALLMLNKDRRNPKGVRGMSVKDLLSS